MQERGRVAVAWGVRQRPLDDFRVRAAVRAALAYGGRPDLSVEVALVSDRRLCAIHGRFLGDSSPTDVMSFDLGEAGGGPGAEIYVSVDRARAVAGERRVPVASELTLYLVHGALHLCGYDDVGARPRARMRAAEAAVLAELGPSRIAARRRPSALASGREGRVRTTKAKKPRASSRAGSVRPKVRGFPRKKSKIPRVG